MRRPRVRAVWLFAQAYRRCVCARRFTRVPDDRNARVVPPYRTKNVYAAPISEIVRVGHRTSRPRTRQSSGNFADAKRKEGIFARAKGVTNRVQPYPPRYPCRLIPDFIRRRVKRFPYQTHARFWLRYEIWILYAENGARNL